MGKRDKDGGLSANQLKGLTYTSTKPKFLSNIASALSGPSSNSASGSRPPIPTRPSDDPNGDLSDNELDERDLGDEAPQVVVLKEGRHLSKAEAEEAQKEAPPPPDPKAEKKSASLRFSSSDDTAKRKARAADEDEENALGNSFGDLVKRAKKDVDSTSTSSAVKRPGADDGAAKKPAKKDTKTSKEDRKAMKAKRKEAQKMLSFEDQ